VIVRYKAQEVCQENDSENMSEKVEAIPNLISLEAKIVFKC